jgi:CRP-like cAMP-binding protein
MANPSVIPADTSVEAWRILRTAVRQMTPEQRVAQWESLNRSISEMQSESIRRANPSMTEAQVHIETIRRNHGPELARIAAEMLKVSRG